MNLIKKYRYPSRIIIVYILLGLLSSETNSQAKNTNVIHHQRTFLKSIKNACVTIHDWDNMRFCFKNGYYKRKNETDTLNNGTIWQTYAESNFLGPIIITKFSFDSLDYGVATIGYSGGGSGYFYFILLFRNVDGNAMQLASETVWDSTGHGRFKSMKVKGDTMFVYIDDYPSVTNRYLYRDDKLINMDRK